MTILTPQETCGECGRPYQNWLTRSERIEDDAGNKVFQHEDSDRIRPYREWRMRWGVPYVNDVPDQIEYRGGRPVAALEITRCDRAPGYKSIPPGYLDAVWRRFTGRDRTQFRSLKRVASALGIPGYMVVFEAGLEEFHVRGLTWDIWVAMDAGGYRAWLEAHR